MSIVTANAAKQYLTTTWSHAPTDPKKVTIAYWRKFISAPSNPTYMLTTASTGGVLFDSQCDTTVHSLVNDDGGGSAYGLTETGSISLADTNWHHICLQVDTTQATSTNRVHIWLDGVDSGSSGTQPALNSDMGVTANGIVSYIGEIAYQIGTTAGIPDAKFAYFYLIDGQALTPSSFTTGTGASCHPAAFGGTYGANGFFLNGNGGTSGSVPDQSGNANNWSAPNGITYSADLPA